MGPSRHGDSTPTTERVGHLSQEATPMDIDGFRAN